MKQLHSHHIAVAACAAVALGASVVLNRAPVAQAETQAASKIAIDAPVAAFSLPDTNGKKTLVGDWGKDGNKATVLIFVSTRCPISNAYNARMADLSKAYADGGVRVMGINSNVAETPDEIKTHAGKNSLAFAILKDKGNAVADRFDARVTPEAYLIDAKGVLRYHGRIDDSTEGDAKSSDLKNAIDAVVAGKAVQTKVAPAIGCSIKREG